MIPFNKPVLTLKEQHHIKKAIDLGSFSGDGNYTKKCQNLIERTTESGKVLMTTSCTDALELSALAIDIKPEDEVIMPSYTFVSTANAFALRGARIKFVDIDPKTMNIDPKRIEAAITKNTKAIVIVHYAGVACDMDPIQNIANHHNLVIIEDAAQCIESYHNNKHLGSFGAMGTLSFHETKNIHCGEGGAILINDPSLILKCEIAREKGTNRSQFLRGQVDKYSWQSLGSSFLPNELSTAFLLPQLQNAKKITSKRIKLWDLYHHELKELVVQEKIECPYIPDYAQHNAHMYYIKTKDIAERTKLTEYLKNNGIKAAFHYVPLHSSNAGRTLGDFIGENQYTTKESERLLRLPLFYDLTEDQVLKVVEAIRNFYKG